jgi:hypothetical protein
MLFIFSTPVLNRHLWQLKTVVFLHWCLIRAVVLCKLWTKQLPVAVLKYYDHHMKIVISDANALNVS